MAGGPCIIVRESEGETGSECVHCPEEEGAEGAEGTRMDWVIGCRDTIPLPPIDGSICSSPQSPLSLKMV